METKEKMHMEFDLGDSEQDKAMIDEVMAKIKGGRRSGQISDRTGRPVGIYWTTEVKK